MKRARGWSARADNRPGGTVKLSFAHVKGTKALEKLRSPPGTQPDAPFTDGNTPHGGGTGLAGGTGCTARPRTPPKKRKRTVGSVGSVGNIGARLSGGKKEKEKKSRYHTKAQPPPAPTFIEGRK